MTYLKIALLCLFIVSNSCKNKKESAPVASKTLKPTLELLWQTDSLLTTCESVLYNKDANIIYVTNVNNDPWSKDNNGFISTIDTSGHILEHKWIEGLHAPKGMGLFNKTLYVNDIDQLVEIDIENGTVIKNYTVEGKPHLNDITLSPEGVVYASCSNTNTVYELKNGILEPIANGDFGRLNGLLFQPEGMYFLSFVNHQLGLINLDDKLPKILTNDLGKADGIIRLENGDFITSSWAGALFYINASDWSKTLLLDTEADKINAADIDYMPEHNMLLVPTFFHNRVMCYKLLFK